MPKTEIARAEYRLYFIALILLYIFDNSNRIDMVKIHYPWNWEEMEWPEIEQPTDSLEPPRPEEIVVFFSSQVFSRVITRVRELAKKYDEIFFNVIGNCKYPHEFYIEEPCINFNLPIFSKPNQKACHYPFINFHSHPLGYSFVPSVGDLRMLQCIGDMVKQHGLGKKFRPILCIGHFIEPYNSNFSLLLFYKNHEMNFENIERNYRKIEFEVGEDKSFENLWKHFQELPCYSFCILDYPNETCEYKLPESEAEKLKQFAKELVNPMQIQEQVYHP